MRWFFLALFLVFPVSVIAANAVTDQSDAIASLTNEVQQLRAENERLSARLNALERRFPSQQKMGVADFGALPLGANPSVGGRGKQ
jgi:histidinol-phosphate/aromatic aminotransferase/cobyric acid decarboxylase-like protein